MLSIKDKNGNEYKFEDHPKYDVQLHFIIENKIIGSFIPCPGVVSAFTISFNGNSHTWSGTSINLTPYDKLKDLKKAHSEGAIIEFYSIAGGKWLDADNNKPVWHKHTNYRIKGNISIESWAVHQDLIKQWGEGAEIEVWYAGEDWEDVTGAAWLPNEIYRIKQAKEMTLAEISKELGYEIKIVKDK